MGELKMISTKHEINIFGIKTEGKNYLEAKFDGCFKDTELEGWVEFSDVIMAIRDGEYDDLPDFPAEAKGVKVLPGINEIWYIGYDEDATEARNGVAAITKYLFGEEIEPKRIEETFTFTHLGEVIEG